MLKDSFVRGESPKPGAKVPRGSTDLVNFYSFLREHNLRREAFIILKDIVDLQKGQLKRKRKRRMGKIQ